MFSIVIAIVVDFLLILFISWLICLPDENTYYYGERRDEKKKF